MVILRRLLVLCLALAAVAVARPARAWTDANVKSVEMRVELDAAGAALVEHALTVVVRGGPLRGVSLAGVPVGVVPTADGSVLSAQPDGPLGVPVPLLVTVKPDGALYAAVQSPNGLPHGTYLFRVRYRQPLVGTGAATPDGSLVRLRFSGATFREGLDVVRCTFVVPRAPHEPRVAGEPGADDDESRAPFLVESHRLAERDELTLTRAHVAKGEVVVWPVRIDPRALTEVNDAHIRPAVEPPPEPPATTPNERAKEVGALGSLAALLALLVAWKSREVAAMARRAGAVVRPLLPVGVGLRALAAGALWAVGVALQRADGEPLAGSALVALATLLVVYRAPVVSAELRGAGRWLPLSDAEAFAPAPCPRRAWLDPATVAGRVTAALVAGLVGIGVAVASRASAFDAWLVAIDAVPWLALFATGGAGELPPPRGVAGAAALAVLARTLRALPWLRVSALGRVPSGARDADELRLLVTPRLARRGFVALEVGHAWVRGLGGHAGVPEVLVRVLDGSPAQEAFTRALAGPRWVRGRKPDERVASVLPEPPLAFVVESLVARLAAAARDDAPPVAARPSRHSPTSAARSPGSGERTANAGTVASPAHAT